MRKSASSNVRTYDLRIVRPSALSDLTCPDGEVAAHIHIPWLNQEDADPDGSNPSSAKAGTFLRLDTAPLTDPSGVTIAIPAGARLLAIHNPPSGTGRRRYIYIDPEGLIGFTPGAVGNADPIAFWPKARGSLIQAIPCGETVTLIGQRGISWLLHLPDDKYSLLHTLPSAPTPDFTMTPDHLEGYTRMAGAYPSITVEVGFKESEEVDGTAFTGWLTEGQASSVSIIFRRRVFEAVGEAVERYIKDTHRVGLWLLPTRCLTCYGHALPGEAVTVDSGYAHPYAKLEEWSWKSRTLTMKLSFSLRPMRLSASYMMTSSHAAWLTLFPVLCFAVAKETPFSNTPDGKVEVNGYTHLTGEQGRAFRFSSKSAETLLAEANTAGQFRIVRQIDTFANTLRFSNLPYPPESSPVFTPDYHDSDTLRPRGGALTDEGVILFGGTAISTSSDGYTYSYSLEENILTPLSPGLPVYRHRTRISDAPVCGAAEITGIKGKDAAARQPLCVISADGIRHITADGTGNYYASKLISRIPGLYPSPTPGVIPCGDSIVFLSPDGLGRLHLSGSVKIFNPGVIARNLMLLTPTYHPSALIVISDGNSYLADTAGESMRLQSADFTGIQPVYDGGTIAWATSDGTLLTPKVTETNCHADDSPSNPGSGVGLPPGYCRYLTRPLKLAGPFIRESIRGLEVVAEDAILSIEGSDNLIDWQEIVHGRTPLRGIYSPCFRFFRVSVIAPRSSSDFLHRLRIVTRLH